MEVIWMRENCLDFRMKVLSEMMMLVIKVVYEGKGIVKVIVVVMVVDEGREEIRIGDESELMFIYRFGLKGRLVMEFLKNFN